MAMTMLTDPQYDAIQNSHDTLKILALKAAVPHMLQDEDLPEEASLVMPRESFRNSTEIRDWLVNTDRLIKERSLQDLVQGDHELGEPREWNAYRESILAGLLLLKRPSAGLIIDGEGEPLIQIELLDASIVIDDIERQLEAGILIPSINTALELYLMTESDVLGTQVPREHLYIDASSAQAVMAHFVTRLRNLDLIDIAEHFLQNNRITDQGIMDLPSDDLAFLQLIKAIHSFLIGEDGRAFLERQADRMMDTTDLVWRLFVAGRSIENNV